MRPFACAAVSPIADFSWDHDLLFSPAKESK